MTQLAERRAFLRYLSPVRMKRWVVYAKPPFAGPEAVIAYLSRYSHRVAISNSRPLRFSAEGVPLWYKDYRKSGAGRHAVMTFSAHELLPRCMPHYPPHHFHSIGPDSLPA